MRVNLGFTVRDSGCYRPHGLMGSPWVRVAG